MQYSELPTEMSGRRYIGVQLEAIDRIALEILRSRPAIYHLANHIVFARAVK